MKAIVCDRYGSPDVLRLEEVPQPVPQENQVLVKIHAASVNPADWHILRADPFLVRLMFGMRRPNFKTLGADIAGTVEAVGSAVRRFRPGDAVYGDMALNRFGGFAEYVCPREDALAPKPANMSFEEAAAVPLAAVTALQSLRNRGNVQPGNSLLIVGASGGVGTFAVQIAKALGAEVTAVCSSANLELVRSLGAHHTIDYTRGDIAADGRTYDRIFVLAGYRSIFDYRRMLKPTGIFVGAGGEMRQMFQIMFLGPLLSKRGGQQVRWCAAKPDSQDLATLTGWIEAGKVRSVIDRRYPLSGVPDAIRYVETKRAKGKVVITF